MTEEPTEVDARAGAGNEAQLPGEPVPWGKRLTSIMGRASCRLPKRETDCQHHHRADILQAFLIGRTGLHMQQLERARD